MDDGLAVEPIRLKWLVGEWRFAQKATQRLFIEEDEKGGYGITNQPAVANNIDHIVIFRLGCFRLAQMREEKSGQQSEVTYALLNGHSGRLSLDVLPAVFPSAWRDQKLIDAVSAKGAEEVPVEKRAEALLWLIDRLDDTGTLMHQDLTYFRIEE